MVNKLEFSSVEAVVQHVQKEVEGEGGHLFCDYSNNAYYYIADFFSDPKPYNEPDKLCVQSFTDRNGTQLRIFENNGKEQAKIDKLDNLAREINEILDDESFDHNQRARYFFEYAIKAAEICGSEESLEKYTNMYKKFKEKQGLT